MQIGASGHLNGLLWLDHADVKVVNEVMEDVDLNSSGLWDEFCAPLKKFIRRRVPSEQDTEDILQEVFARIFGSISSLKDGNKLDAWVYQIARNAIADYYRRQKKTTDSVELLEGMDTESDDVLSPSRELTSCLRPIINSLPEKYKQAILLTEFQNLTQRELSERLGLSLSGAKSRVRRARSLLKKTLLGCCRLEFDRLGNIIDYTHKTNSCKFC